VTMGERLWISDPNIESPDFVIRVDRDGECRGWVTGGLDVVLDLVSDADWADAVGEDSDTIAVFVLTDVAPIPCKIMRRACRDMGMIETEVSWRASGVRGRASWQKVSGFTKIIDF